MAPDLEGIVLCGSESVSHTSLRYTSYADGITRSLRHSNSTGSMTQGLDTVAQQHSITLTLLELVVLSVYCFFFFLLYLPGSCCL